MWDCCRSSPVEWCNRFVSFGLGYVALRIVGCGGGVRSVPGIVDSVVGRRPNTGARLGSLINQKSHVIRVPELSVAPRKRCNSNDAISMFEIHVGELRATFLRNHNMRRHKDPSRRQPRQKTPQAQKTEDPQARNTTQAEDNSSTEDPRNPDSRHNRHKHGGTALVTWRCTRYVAVHPNRRGVMPTVRVQRPNKQEQTRNWHTEPLTATPLHAHLDPTGGRMGTPPTAPTPPPALRPTPAHSDTSYTLTCEEPVNLRAGGSRAPPDWPTT